MQGQHRQWEYSSRSAHGEDTSNKEEEGSDRQTSVCNHRNFEGSSNLGGGPLSLPTQVLFLSPVRCGQIISFGLVRTTIGIGNDPSSRIQIRQVIKVDPFSCRMFNLLLLYIHTTYIVMWIRSGTAPWRLQDEQFEHVLNRQPTANYVKWDVDCQVSFVVHIQNHHYVGLSVAYIHSGCITHERSRRQSIRSFLRLSVMPEKEATLRRDNKRQPSNLFKTSSSSHSTIPLWKLAGVIAAEKRTIYLNCFTLPRKVLDTGMREFRN